MRIEFGLWRESASGDGMHGMLPREIQVVTAGVQNAGGVRWRGSLAGSLVFEAWGMLNPLC